MSCATGRRPTAPGRQGGAETGAVDGMDRSAKGEARMGEDGSLRLPARRIPLPGSISAPAREFLLSQSAPRRHYPPPGDLAAWRRLIDGYNASFLDLMDSKLQAVAATVTKAGVNGVSVHIGQPRNSAPDMGWINLSLHGGALVFSGGELVATDAAMAVHRTGCVSYAVDYRMPPDHPFPAGLEDCVAAYRGLIESHAPSRIVISGRSAGGNLAAATILRLKALGLPLPGALVLMTPELDLTESGDSFETLRGIDVVLKAGLPEANALYAGGHDLRDPLISPLFGELTGFPPTLLQAGTRDLFLSNAVRMHRALRAADVEAELHVWEAMPHGDFGGFTPEDDEMWREIRRFLNRIAHPHSHGARRMR